MKAKPEGVAFDGSDTELKSIAENFITARRECRPLDAFPGDVPADLGTAYRIQDIAIDHWQDSVNGWKVGRIPPAVEGQFGIDRLAGPIFASAIVSNGANGSYDMPVFPGGFSAVEAEYVAVIADDAPAGKTEWSTEEAAEFISDLRIGLEIASSPLSTINDLGPTVVVADFGNNNGLIVGPSIENWRARALDTMRCTAKVDESEVGSGGAFTLTGGFVRSVQFLLELSAKRGRPLKKGQFVATGQTTGIHDVEAGQTSSLDFGRDGQLTCRLVPAKPS